MISEIQNTMLIFVRYLKRLIVMLAFASPQVHFQTNQFGTPFLIHHARGGDRGEHERIELRDGVIDKILTDGGGKAVDHYGVDDLRIAHAKSRPLGRLPRSQRQTDRYQEAGEVGP